MVRCAGFAALVLALASCSDAEQCPGSTDCAGTCVDLATSRASCGACGNACGGLCTASTCVSEVGGLYSSLPDESGFARDYLLGLRISLRAGRVVALTNRVPASAAGKKVVMGLYADAADAPGSLVVATAEATLVEGLNLIPVPSTAIAEGNYWLLAVYQTMTMGYRGPDLTTHRYVSHAYGTPLPATFPAAHSAETAGWYPYGVGFGP